MKNNKCAICLRSFVILFLFKRERTTCQRCKLAICNSCRVSNYKTSKLSKFFDFDYSEYLDLCINCQPIVCECCKKESVRSSFTLIESDRQTFRLCQKCNSSLIENQRIWVSGSKNDSLKNHKIIKEHGLIQVRSIYENPGEVEENMISLALLAGGNSYIKFFLNTIIEHHQEEYEAGKGPRGNPYYKNRHYTTRSFNGHAIAVSAVPCNTSLKS